MPISVLQYFKMDWTCFKVFILFFIAAPSWATPPLSISPQQNEVVKYVNDTYIASCKSDRGIHVMWTRPSGEQITSTKGRIRVEDRKGLNLIFMSLEKKDRGDYTCSATVDGREHKQSFKLVIVKPISFLDTPKIQNATEHQDTLIRCEVDGDPEPKVVWQVKGRAPEVPRHKVMADGLFIRNVTLADRGDYLCRAFQASSIASNIAEQSISLRVQHKPQWPTEQSERGRAYGFVSGHVNLSCAAVAEPEPNFQWMKGNRSIEVKEPHTKLFQEPSRSVLQLAVQNDSVFGEYVCRASNSLGALERVVVLHKAVRPATPNISVQTRSAESITISLIMPGDQAISSPQPGAAPLEISGYRVQAKMRDEPTWNKALVFDFDAESGPLYAMTGLQPDVVYSLRAAAKNSAGIGNYGEPMNYRTLRTSSAPNDAQPLDNATSSATISLEIAQLLSMVMLLLLLPC